MIQFDSYFSSELKPTSPRSWMLVRGWSRSKCPGIWLWRFPRFVRSWTSMVCAVTLSPTARHARWLHWNDGVKWMKRTCAESRSSAYNIASERMWYPIPWTTQPWWSKCSCRSLAKDLRQCDPWCVFLSLCLLELALPELVPSQRLAVFSKRLQATGNGWKWLCGKMPKSWFSYIFVGSLFFFEFVLPNSHRPMVSSKSVVHCCERLQRSSTRNTRNRTFSCGFQAQPWKCLSFGIRENSV